MRKGRLTAPLILGLVCLTFNGCSKRPAVDRHAAQIAEERLEPKRQQGAAQQAMVRATAERLEYERSPERMDEVAHTLFSGLGLIEVDCWAEYEATAYCGIFPKMAPNGIIANFADDIDALVMDDVAPVYSWFYTSGVTWRDYAMDGLQLFRIYMWRYYSSFSVSEYRLALVFE